SMAGVVPYVAGFLQYLIFIWPQQTFVTLHRAGRDGAQLLPYRLSYLLGIGFWLTAALMFGLLAHRMRSLRVLVPVAVAYVIAVVRLVVWTVPMLGWRISIETP